MAKKTKVNKKILQRIAFVAAFALIGVSYLIFSNAQTIPPTPYNYVKINGLPINVEAYSATQIYVAASDGGIFALPASDPNVATPPPPLFSDASGAINPVGKSSHPIKAFTLRPQKDGYWFADSEGMVWGYGNAPVIATLPSWRAAYPGQVVCNNGYPTNSGSANVVDMSVPSSGGAYVLLGSCGEAYVWGMPYYGSLMNAGSPLDITNAGFYNDFVAVAARPQGDGYWMVRPNGAIYAFGSAGYFGGANNLALNKPIVDIRATASGNGYTLFAADGGTFNYGDANYNGSLANLKDINGNIVALNSDVKAGSLVVGGLGYFMVANDGGVFALGSAQFPGRVVAPQGQCTSGQTGTWPNCVNPPCPSGQVGTWPNCTVPPPTPPATPPTGTPKPTAPAKPLHVKLLAADSASVTIQWDNAKGADYYVIAAQNTANINEPTVSVKTSQTGSNILSAQINGLKSGSSYIILVSAFNNIGYTNADFFNVSTQTAAKKCGPDAVPCPNSIVPSSAPAAQAAQAAQTSVSLFITSEAKHTIATQQASNPSLIPGADVVALNAFLQATNLNNASVAKQAPMVTGDGFSAGSFLSANPSTIPKDSSGIPLFALFGNMGSSVKHVVVNINPAYTFKNADYDFVDVLVNGASADNPCSIFLYTAGPYDNKTKSNTFTNPKLTTFAFILKNMDNLATAQGRKLNLFADILGGQKCTVDWAKNY